MATGRESLRGKERDTASPSAAYWAVPVELLLARVGATVAGLDAAEAQARLGVHGPNRLTAAHRGPIHEALVSQLKNPLSWLLIFAAVVGAAVGELADATIVLVILGLSAVLSFLQEAQAGRAVEKLAARVALRSVVLRGGEPTEVPATALVPGDVLVLAAGTVVAADAVLLDARELHVAEAVLTGEPFAVEKHPGPVPEAASLPEQTNVVHMGTNVRSGTGRAVVVETGARTAFGQLQKLMALPSPETEFQHGLRRFGYLLLSIMVVLVFLVFAASAVRAHPPIEALLFAVALAVGLAPEMLPAVLATMLGRGATRLADHGVLVRRLEAIENLGIMDVLCTDKTGTLTEGEIELESATDVQGAASDRVLRLTYWNAKLQTGLSNPLDRAIVASRPELDAELPRKTDELPFDFSRKRLSVLVEPSPGKALLVTKGAADPLLSVCSWARQSDGGLSPLDAALRDALHARVTEAGGRGVRMLGVATRAWSEGQALTRDSERELVLEGFVAFRDPPKAGVAEAIHDLRGLGVRVKIVSGDNPSVVGHLAGEIGLGAGRIARGRDLALLRDDALRHLARRCDLFAEIDPTQKERLVLALKKSGHVVGFMGDGVNDAPAIHAADVGISVDSATDVAREAADFVLLRRGLDTVRDGVMAGRKTFANTIKYVLTTESANLGNMASMAAASLFLPFLPLLAHQILLNNLLSDIPSMTLSADRVDPEILERPEHWDVAFIRRFMILFGFISAVFDGLTFVAMTQLFHASPEAFRTAWFAESLLSELFVLFALRTRRRAWRSMPHPALLASTLLVAVTAVALPLSPLRTWLGFVALSPSVWVTVFAIAVGYVLTVELVKVPAIALLRRWGRRDHPHVRRPRPPHHVWPR